MAMVDVDSSSLQADSQSNSLGRLKMRQKTVTGTYLTQRNTKVVK